MREGKIRVIFWTLEHSTLVTLLEMRVIFSLFLMDNCNVISFEEKEFSTRYSH